jgi:alkyldihydroxyacetonephosphate synthase
MLYEELNSNINYDRQNLRWDGWGAKDQDFFLKKHISDITQLIQKEWGISFLPDTPGVKLEQIQLKKTRLSNDFISEVHQIFSKESFTTEAFERIFHSVGKSYFDVLRLRFNLIKEYVDGVVYPKTNEELFIILKLCKMKNIAVIPFGGGSSVVGGLEALKTNSQKAILSIDMTQMNKLLEIDKISNIAKFEAGIYGPKLEKILGEHGYTLGHFPQSFEYSTLGGWVAARSSGQQSGKYGKIEKIIISAKMITPEGEINTPKLPPYSMGPDINQIIAGSEGLLGVISEVSVKIQPLPASRKYFAILFPKFSDGAQFIKKINTEGLKLSMMRLSDENETYLFSHFADLGKPNTPFRKFKKSITKRILKWNGIGESRSAMIAGIDSNPKTIEYVLKQTKLLAKEYNGFYGGTSPGKNWLKSRYNMPFLRNHFMEIGIGVDTLETSTTYNNLENLYESVIVSIRKSIPVCSAMCHISHSYSEGASLYFTIIFPLNITDPISQWKKMKQNVSETIINHGGSISHHHGVGFDHKEYYQKLMDPIILTGLTSLRKNWDSKGIMNPGKLFLN